MLPARQRLPRARRRGIGLVVEAGVEDAVALGVLPVASAVLWPRGVHRGPYSRLAEAASEWLDSITGVVVGLVEEGRVEEAVEVVAARAVELSRRIGEVLAELGLAPEDRRGLAEELWRMLSELLNRVCEEHVSTGPSDPLQERIEDAFIEILTMVEALHRLWLGGWRVDAASLRRATALLVVAGLVAQRLLPRDKQVAAEALERLARRAREEAATVLAHNLRGEAPHYA